ncbi:hypothetical protein PAEPH01_2054 [Pancytospora epiphaga]|nr:hypothetical protein PAEPH01_2054 [Pancytospora epiphaga]
MRFIGFVNYYRKYIKDMATIATPLYEALKTKPFEMNKRAVKAFETLKETLNKDVAVHIADFNKEFYILTDAFNTGLGATLQQKVEGKLVVVDWASKKLSPA